MGRPFGDFVERAKLARFGHPPSVIASKQSTFIAEMRRRIRRRFGHLIEPEGTHIPFDRRVPTRWFFLFPGDTMLTPGNKKLGAELIWGFGLPSGRANVCVAMTPTCRRVCYSRRTEQYRVRAAQQYERNLRFTRKKDFVRRVRAFLIAHHVRVVRIHTGGEFVSARYARKWLKIIRRSPQVRFFTYTRAWSIPAIHEVLAAMAALPNCQVWFSLDRDTGRPDAIPVGVRLAWLMVTPEDRPTIPVDLIFRVQALRRQPLAQLNGTTVCHAESGIQSETPVTCDHCRLCWRAPASKPSRIPLMLASSL